jgi:predicted PurR-regulated permease PerM
MKQMNTISIIALILIFLGGVGAILLTIGQSISSTDDKTDIINTTKNENSALKKDLIEIKRERDSLNKTLALRDSNIQKQNKNIIDLSQ